VTRASTGMVGDDSDIHCTPGVLAPMSHLGRRTAGILGPIRPEHAAGGSKLEGDDRGRWFLSKSTGRALARIQATTPTTCSWGIYRPDGQMIREASARCVDSAKSAVDTWIQEQYG